jgi:hypothetical protein
MSLNGTVQISRSQFITAAASYIESEAASLITTMDDAKPLVDQLNGIASEARAYGVQLDDESAKADPVVAELRSRIDPLVKKIKHIQEKLDEEIQESNRLKDMVKTIISDGVNGTISLSVPDAMRLLKMDATGLI